MIDNQKNKNCIIYCRVSTSKQAQDGESLDLQESICYDIAEKKNLRVLNIFKEQYSGRKEDRPVIDDIFEYLKKSPKKVDVLIVRAIDRFTRNGTFGYESLIKKFAEYGVEIIDSYGMIQPSKNTLEHLSVEYDWSIIRPSEITEMVMAQQGKNEVNQILTRTIGAEIALVREGYHIGPAREGYMNTKLSVNGKKKPIQIPDPEYSHFYIKMFELRSFGNLTDQEIVSNINAIGYRSKIRNKWSKNKDKVIGSTGGLQLNTQHLQKIISNPIYCGVNNGKWVLKPIKTKYSGLISISLFNKANKGKLFIEEIENEDIKIHKNYNPHSLKRIKDNPLFPFKSVIRCPECAKPFLGSVSKGKSGAGFPSYHCARNHKQYGVNKKDFEKNIAYYIKNIKHDEEFFKALQMTLANKYKEKKKELGEFFVKASINIKDLEDEKLLKINAFTGTKNETIRETLERQIEEIQEQIIEAQKEKEKMKVKEEDLNSFLRYAKYLMEHQEELLLKQSNLTILRSLFGLVFEELPTYEEILNGTPKLSLIYKLSEDFRDYKSLVAGDE